MRKSITMLAITAMSTAGVYAQQPQKLSLQDCIDYAVKNSYAMKNAHLDVMLQQEQVKLTTAAAMPHVNAKADWNHFIDPQYSYFSARAFAFGVPDSILNLIPKDQVSKLPFTIPFTINTSATVSQTLFDGSLVVALQARNTVMEMARENEKVTTETIKYNVYKAYSALAIAYKQFNILSNTLRLSREMQSDLIKTREAGFAEKIDVDRFSVQINNLASDSMRISNLLTVSEQMLKYSIGMNINTPIVLTDTAIDSKSSEALKLISTNLDYSELPEYNALLIGLKLTQFDVRRYKLSALPTLSGFYSYGFNTGQYTGTKVFNFDSSTYKKYSMVGLSLNVPIFNGFARQHQVRAARLSMEKMENNIENMKLSLDFQTATSRTSLRNAMLQVQSQKRNMELAQSVLDLAQKKYKEGVGSNLEVTTAQTDLLRSQNSYFSTLLDMINAEADLKRALGMLK